MNESAKVTTPCPACGRYHARAPSTVQRRQRVKELLRCAACSIGLNWWCEEPHQGTYSPHDAAQRLEDRRSGAIFAYGIGDAMARKVHVGYHPKSDPDADCLMAWGDGELDVYVPVQLKDLVPGAGESPTDALNRVIAELETTYPTSHDLVVAIAVKCDHSPRVEDIRIPEMRLAGFWLFGPIDDTGTWNVWGDLLQSEAPREHRFTLPTAPCRPDGRAPWICTGQEA